MKITTQKVFKDIWIGIKFAFKLPSLPESVNKFHNNPITRVFRVMGGISILFVLSGSEFAKKYLFYVIFPLAFLQFIYIIVINLIKFFYIIYLWRNKKLEVRNSPLNRLASFSVTLISCVKGTCVLGLSGGTALGMGLGIDELLINYGRDPIFRDTLGKGLDKVLTSMGFENPHKDIPKIDGSIKELKFRYNKLVELDKDINDLSSLTQQAGIKDSDFVKEIKEDIKTRIEEEKRSIAIQQSKILSQLNKNSPFTKK